MGNHGVTNIERASFDKAARTYDDEFERLPATRRLRQIIWDTYYTYFQSGDALLELNCGTGTDAIELGSNGMHVLATDASQEMLRETERKIYGQRRSFIQTQLVPFQKLNILKGQRFDGVYSNFGGLNCTRHLDEVASDLSVLVKARGYVILCLMSKYSAWEILSFLIRGKFKKAFRRFSENGTLANVHGETVWVQYYTTGEAAKIFSPYFSTVEVYGLNIFSPPPNSQLTYKVLGPVARLLEKLDDMVAHVGLFSDIGDHFVIVLQRRG